MRHLIKEELTSNNKSREGSKFSASGHQSGMRLFTELGHKSFQFFCQTSRLWSKICKHSAKPLMQTRLFSLRDQLSLSSHITMPSSMRTNTVLKRFQISSSNSSYRASRITTSLNQWLSKIKNSLLTLRDSHPQLTS